MLKRILFLLFVAFIVSTTLFAGTTGKLAGRVTDDKGKPIPMANIVLEGTEIGARTKPNGQFIIINIAPGNYNVVCMRSGFNPQKITGVVINLDLTTVQNFKLDTDAIQIEGMTVTEATVELVNANKTGSGRMIAQDEMTDVAVQDLNDVIALQAGVTEQNGEIHVRGGRSNEVAYTVDGMSVSDPVDGGAALSVDMDAVEFTDVKTGSFTAEYGNAQSGIVNIVTKSGGPMYAGKIELITDHVIPDSYHSNMDNLKFALGGPLLTPMVSNLKDKLTFFMNVSGQWYDTRYWKHYKNNPVEELQYLTSQSFDPNDPYVDRDDIIGFDTGDRNFNDYNGNLKFKYQITATTNLTFAVRGDRSKFDAFNYDWKYALDHYQQGESQQLQYVGTFDKTFIIGGQPANLKIKGSYYNKEITRGPKGIELDDFFVRNDADFDLYDPNGNDIYQCSGIDYLTDADGLVGIESIYPWSITSDGMEKFVLPFIQPGSIYNFFQDDQNSTATLRTDFEYQASQIHGIKTGLELIQHDITKNQITTPWIIDQYRYDEFLTNNFDPVDSTRSVVDTTQYVYLYDLDAIYASTLAASGQTDGYESSPIQAAYYLQDKMEWEGMIVNAGLRFDFWYLGEKYKIVKNGGIAFWEEFDKEDRFQMMVSPRLGISHPISETAVMHFAYNYQNQLPQMQYVFTTSTPEDAITSNTNVVVGQPTLEPQITVTYEVGLQKQLGLDYAMDIQAYFKNIYNYVSTREVQDPVNDNVSWYEYYSEDYGSARGIDFNLEKRLSNYIMGSASYSLAWAQGNNSETVIQSTTTNLREFPLDWDSRHNFSLNATFRVGQGEGFVVPFTEFEIPAVVIQDFTTSFTYNIASGTPYTPATEVGTAMDVNSELQSHTETANLKFTKKVRFFNDKFSLKAYLNIGNLFNRRNVYSVYAITGSPYYDGVDISEPNSTYTAEEVSYVHDLGSRNPSNVSQGRTYTMGFSINF